MVLNNLPADFRDKAEIRHISGNEYDVLLGDGQTEDDLCKAFESISKTTHVTVRPYYKQLGSRYAVTVFQDDE